jgi:hypothetical protein
LSRGTSVIVGHQGGRAWSSVVKGDKRWRWSSRGTSVVVKGERRASSLRGSVLVRDGASSSMGSCCHQEAMHRRRGRALSSRGWAGASGVCGGESDEFLMSSNASKFKQKPAKASK